MGLITIGKLLSFDLLVSGGHACQSCDDYYPVLNLRFLTFMLSIAISGLIIKIRKEEIYKYITIILGFILIHIETNEFISINDNISYLLTVMWLLYAGIITLVGIFKNIKCLKNAGIWISIAAIIRIFTFDLADTDTLYKLIAYITLGVILLIVSYFYNKKR